jgi:hypothetical protein
MLLVLVVLVGWNLRFVMGMFVIVVVGMAVGQIPMGVFVFMFDHRRRGLASQASATFAHMDLLAPCPGMM